MEGKAILFWVFLAAGGLAFALYIIVNMHSHGHACFGRRKKPADVEHGHALPELADTRQSSTTTLVNDSPIKNAGEANSQPENLPTNMTETNGQPGDLPSVAIETNGQPEIETKRKLRRFSGKEDLKSLRLAKRRFGGKKDLQPLRLAYQTSGAVDQSVQSARPTRFEREG
jgi:hypothetical protein